MDNFITIKTFTYPHELAVIRGRLESEGIECFAKDELMAQVNPFYSNAIGGVKLQVRESDLQKSVEILREAGYLNDADFLPSPLYNMINRMTANIPGLKNIRVEFRLMIIAAVFVLFIIFILWEIQ